LDDSIPSLNAKELSHPEVEVDGRPVLSAILVEVLLVVVGENDDVELVLLRCSIGTIGELDPESAKI
jgi:hypothetical protein